MLNADGDAVQENPFLYCKVFSSAGSRFPALHRHFQRRCPGFCVSAESRFELALPKQSVCSLEPWVDS